MVGDDEVKRGRVVEDAVLRVVGREFRDAVVVELGEVSEVLTSPSAVDGEDLRIRAGSEETEDLAAVLARVVEVEVADSIAGVEIGTTREGGSWSLEIREVEALVKSSVESSRDSLVESARRSEGEEGSDDEGNLRESAVKEKMLAQLERNEDGTKTRRNSPEARKHHPRLGY